MRVASSSRLEPTTNSLFGRLDDDAQTFIKPTMEYVSMTSGNAIAEPGSVVNHLLLPLTCVIGVINVSEDGASTLLGLIGSEGLVGLSAFLSGRVVSNGAFVCTPGVAIRVPAAALQHVFASNARVRNVVLRYAQAFVAEMLETAHCGRHHTATQQLSVVLLRATDKQGGGDLFMTHERLASMLGVRRETISYAAQVLSARGLIQYRRGRVCINDREGLEQVACGCFRKIRSVYERVYSEA